MIPALVLLLGVAGFRTRRRSPLLRPIQLLLDPSQVTIRGGQTLIVLTAGIDLSVGAIMVITSVIMGQLAVDFGVPLLGQWRSSRRHGRRSNTTASSWHFSGCPICIVTLGTWSIYLSIIYFSESKTIRSQDVEAAAPLLQWLGTPLVPARPTYGSLAMILPVACFWYILNLTAYGRHIYAIGDDLEAARLPRPNRPNSAQRLRYFWSDMRLRRLAVDRACSRSPRSPAAPLD